MKVVGYIRVSTVKQVEEGVSLDMQEAMIERHVRLLEFIKEDEKIKYYIDDGYSSKSLERPAMQEMITKIKAGEIDIIFVYRFDRISRDIVDSKVFLDLCQKYNVKVKSLKDDVRTKTAGDRFGTNVKIVANAYEREVIVERTNDGLLQIVESGRYPCGGSVPFGYFRGEDKDIYINEDTAWIIRKIIDLAKNGAYLDEISKKIVKETKVKKFDSYSVEKIILDLRYSGIFTYKGKEYLNIIPAIVSREDQELAMRNYGKKYSAKSGKYYLYNVVYCTCGTKLTCTHSINHAGNKYYYYHCSNCKSSVAQKKLIEKLFVRTGIKVSNQQKEANIKREIKNIKRRIKRVKENYLLENYNDKEYCFLIVPLDDELRELQIQLAMLKKELLSIEEFNRLSDKEKRVYIHLNYSKIIVSAKNKKIEEVILADR